MTLPMRLRPTSVFASYIVGPNDEIVRYVERLAPDARPLVTYLYGPIGVGKTHLLQAICAQAGTQNRPAAYLPLRELQSVPQAIDGCEMLAFVCLDDVDLVIGNAEWERALFRLHTLIDDQPGRLVLSGTLPPAHLKFKLADLGSRLAAGTILRLRPLSDEQQSRALTMRAHQLGLELPDDVAQFLHRHLPRDMGSLCAALDRLDQASLASQRRLTLPFVRATLADAQR